MSPDPARACVLLVLACGLGTGVAGCSRLASRDSHALTPADFAAASRPATPVQPAPQPTPPAAPPVTTVQTRRDPLPTWEPPTAAESIDVTAYVGQPAPPAGDALPLDRPLVLDALVGQINGRPVYASEILEPLDGKLLALTQQTSDQRAWLRQAGEAINGELQRLIQDELILAEARASLTPEQRQGLFRFLGALQGNIVSEQRGSALAADESLRATTGRSLYQEARDRLDRELILNEIRTRVTPRVNISWRQIQQAYERDHARYNPPATANIRVILVPADKPDSKLAVQEQLEAGVPFATVAAGEHNGFNSAEAGLVKREFSGDFTQATFFPAEQLNQAAQGLSPGQTLGPIDFEGRAAWLHLESIEQSPGVSLYDAQLDIERQLRQQKFDEEVRRLFDRLMARGSISRIEDMNARLLAVAAQRYLGLSN